MTIAKTSILVVFYVLFILTYVTTCLHKTVMTARKNDIKTKLKNNLAYN